MIARSDRSDYGKQVKLLTKNWKAPNDLEPEGGETEGIKDVLDNFSFAVRKIEALKRISRIAAAGSEGQFFKSLKLDIRLRNINRALYSIRNCLRDVIQETES